MNENTRTLVGTVLVAGLGLALLVGVAGFAGASHGSPGEWEIQPAEPSEDAQPGADSASYIHWAQGGDDFRGEGLEVVHNIEMESEVLSFADCSLFDVKEFGIDRGANNEGTETDDDIAPHVKEFEFAEDRQWMTMYREGDVGGSPMHLRAEDQFVAHQLDCYGNPDSPGWYQIEGWANGTAYDGEFDEARLFSHYFWICDCEDEEEAREQLGPPPSEETEETPTPTPEPDESDADADEDDGSADEDDDAEADTDDTEADTDDDTDADDGDGTDTHDTDTDDADTTDGGDSEADADEDDSSAGEDDAEADTGDDSGADDDAADDVQEVTPGDGPGFGALAALGALFGAAFLARRA